MNKKSQTSRILILIALVVLVLKAYYIGIQYETLIYFLMLLAVHEKIGAVGASILKFLKGEDDA